MISRETSAIFDFGKIGVEGRHEERQLWPVLSAKQDFYQPFEQDTRARVDIRRFMTLTVHQALRTKSSRGFHPVDPFLRVEGSDGSFDIKGWEMIEDPEGLVHVVDERLGNFLTAYHITIQRGIYQVAHEADQLTLF